MLKIMVAQINTSVGNFIQNLNKIKSSVMIAANKNADIVVFPEATITGYPQKDLLYNQAFIDANTNTFDDVCVLSKAYSNLVIIVGHVVKVGLHLYNVASAIKNGKVNRYYKQLLPNKVVFDERRYFTPGTSKLILDVKGTKIGLIICEDAWDDDYDKKPVSMYKDTDLIISLNASPFSKGKVGIRKQVLTKRSTEVGKSILYVNQVGSQDGLIFDGASMIVNGDIAEMIAPQFTEANVMVQFEDHQLKHIEGTVNEYPSDTVQIKKALVLGISDYFYKTKFEKAVLGLSGGVDSALTAALAVEALGALNVHGLLMPSAYSSQGSITDAQDLVNNLGMTSQIVNIEQILQVYNIALGGIYKSDVTEQNLQARIRGCLLMAVSNDEGRLLLSTGNKSEMSVGYCTLYGDMCGGLSVISDVYKTTIYKICELYLQIPKNTITKPPSAELKPEQKDTDSLPPYDILDGILKRYIEKNMSADDIIDNGFDYKTVARVIQMVDKNEYKRHQAAPGLIISERDLIIGRRMPIANLFNQFQGK